MRALITYRIHNAYCWRGVDRRKGFLDLTVSIPEVDVSTPEGAIEEQNNLCEELTTHLGHIIIRCNQERIGEN